MVSMMRTRKAIIILVANMPIRLSAAEARRKNLPTLKAHHTTNQSEIFTLNDADNARMKMNVGTVDDQSVLKYHISVAAKIAEGCKKRRLKSGHFFVQRLTLNKSLINILQTYLETTFVKSPIAQKLKRRECQIVFAAISHVSNRARRHRNIWRSTERQREVLIWK